MDVHNRRWLYRGRRFQVEQIDYQVGGGLFTKDVVRHPGAVVILPWVDAEHVCLVKNFRPAIGATLWELPAGTREPDELPLETAQRELEEETGYRATWWKLLHSFYVSPGILDEEMHLFMARNLVEGSPRREPGEEIQTEVVSWHDAMYMVKQGHIRDAKTLIGLLWFETLGVPDPEVERR